MRIDILLTQKGLAKSRTAAKELILSGNVIADGKICKKPSEDVLENAELLVTNPLKYVSRGGLKLEGALSAFNINVNGLTCVDLGASTGGFTDCLLQNGAKAVYAVDVGTAQLDRSLADDKRITVMEKTNVRSLNKDSFKQEINFVTADLSFISVTYSAAPIKSFLSEHGSGVILIKPQFEAGKQALSKSGVVRDKKSHIAVLQRVTEAFENEGFSICGICPSPIKGGDGNIEYLMYIENYGASSTFDFKKIAEEAFGQER